MFDGTYIFMIFPTYVSSSFWSNRNINFSLRKAFDPRRGCRHLYILHSPTVATRGFKTYVGRCNWTSKSYVLRPKSYVKNSLTSPDIGKRCRSNICFVLPAQNICFGSFDPTLRAGLNRRSFDRRTLLDVASVVPSGLKKRSRFPVLVVFWT